MKAGLSWLSLVHSWKVQWNGGEAVHAMAAAAEKTAAGKEALPGQAPSDSPHLPTAHLAHRYGAPKTKLPPKT